VPDAHATAGARCALYLRVSLDATGELLAVTRQREDCRRIAASRGWAIVREYVDNSISASDKRKDRPGYNALVEDYAAGRFDALVCYDLDRLTRQPRQLEDWIDAAADRGLLLVTSSGDADLTTDNGITQARVKLAFAAGEVLRNSARRKRSNRQRADLGKPPLGVRLTGYTSAGELVPAEADVIREVFALFAAGESLAGLTTWLDGTSLRPRHAERWKPSSVRGILTNPRYCGRQKYQGQTTGTLGGWEPLVDEATFDVIQARLADPRRRTQVGTDRKYLGSGLYLCGACPDRPELTSFSQARYWCRACGMSRTQGPVDEYVVTLTRALLARPDLADLLPARDDPAAKRLAEELTRLRRRLERVEADYDEDLIDARRYATKRDKLLSELRRVEQAQARTAAGRGAAGLVSAADPVGYFDGASLMIRRGVVAALMRVEVLPSPRGRRGFDPATVRITPRVRGE
jgi:DNA invertase Pin-like site-specific DNA recombinase